MNIDINILFSVIGAIFVGLIWLIWYLIQLKIVDIDKKRDKETCDEIHKATDEKIFRRLSELDVKLTNKFSPNLSVGKSPRHPSEVGKKILQDSGWNEIYNNIKEEIFDWIDKENPKTLYDVERSAFYVLYKNKDDERFALLKNYVVNNPEVELGAIFLTASWIIRDEYWEYRNK